MLSDPSSPPWRTPSRAFRIDIASTVANDRSISLSGGGFVTCHVPSGRGGLSGQISPTVRVHSVAMDGDEREMKVFAQLYGSGFGRDESLRGDQRPITRRMAYYLWSTASVLHDQWRMFAQDFEEHRDLWSDELPPVAVRWATQEWMIRFSQCFEDLAERLKTGAFTDYGIAQCTGDEVAVVLVLQLADCLVKDGELALPDKFDEFLPGCGERDEDFSGAHDVLTADADVELLWDMSMDGIENDTSTEMRFVNLHPRDWFLPFA